MGLAYRLGRRALGVLATVARSDGALMAQVLALRHENAVLRRQITRVRYEPADRAWFAALSALVPRHRWGQVFPVTPATLLSWHRRLVARRYTPAHRPHGHPSTKPLLKTLILRMARENPFRGHPGSRASWSNPVTESRIRPCGRSRTPPDSTQRRTAPGPVGGSSRTPGHTR